MKIIIIIIIIIINIIIIIIFINGEGTELFSTAVLTQTTTNSALLHEHHQNSPDTPLRDWVAVITVSMATWQH